MSRDGWTSNEPRLRSHTADSELNEISEEKWTAKGDVNSLVQSYSTFAPVFQKLLGYVVGRSLPRYTSAPSTNSCSRSSRHLRTADEVGLWQLRDQEPLDRWTKGKAILLGDAAHASKSSRLGLASTNLPV